MSAELLANLLDINSYTFGFPGEQISSYDQPSSCEFGKYSKTVAVNGYGTCKKCGVIKGQTFVNEDRWIDNIWSKYRKKIYA